MSDSPKKKALAFIQSLPEDIMIEKIIVGLQTLHFEEKFNRLRPDDQELVAQVVRRMAVTEN
jgi:hypothetical protein